jgi:DNA invertase Pin-like site-specific DNA recombinase
MALYGYARVSTLDQDLRVQHAALKDWRSCGIFMSMTIFDHSIW